MTALERFKQYISYDTRSCGTGPDTPADSKPPELVQALAAYPGQGTEFLQCALLCPVVSCRTHALNTLEGWVNLSAAPLKGIAPQLMPVLAQAEVLEVKEELRNRILRLKEKEA